MTEHETAILKNIEDGKNAMQRVLELHEDVFSAMVQEDVGAVDFIWGVPGRGEKFKHGYGISHIIAKRQSENECITSVMNHLVEAIARGTQTERQESFGGEARLKIHYDGCTAVLSLHLDGRNAWLLTGWKDAKKGSND